MGLDSCYSDVLIQVAAKLHQRHKIQQERRKTLSNVKTFRDNRTDVWPRLWAQIQRVSQTYK